MLNIKTTIFTLLVIAATAAAWDWDSMSPGGEINERIYNGYLASRGQFPYVARIQQSYNNNTKFTGCTGSVLSDRWILVAAHCAQGAETATVLLGQTDTNNYTGVQWFSVVKSGMYMHPAWNASTVQNDIALYQLTTPIQFSKFPYIGKINLPKKSQSNVSVFDNMNGTTSGFGAYNDTSGSQNLRWAVTHVYNHTQCVSQLTKLMGPKYPVTDRMICCDMSLQHGFCSGDSGGPLAMNTTSSGDPVVIGVTSFALGDCSNTYPRVYSYVPQYLDWINQVTGLAIS